MWVQYIRMDTYIHTLPTFFTRWIKESSAEINKRKQRLRRRHHIGWLRLVGSLKLQVSCAKELYKRDYILPKRPIIWRSLLIVATPYIEYICTYEYTYSHIRIHTHTVPTSSADVTIHYIYIHPWIYIYTHTHTYTHIHVCCIYIHIYIYVSSADVTIHYIHMHLWIYKYTHTYTFNIHAPMN